MNINQYAEQNGFSLRRAGGKYYLGLANGDVICKTVGEVRTTIDSEVADREAQAEPPVEEPPVEEPQAVKQPSRKSQIKAVWLSRWESTERKELTPELIRMGEAMGIKPNSIRSWVSSWHREART